MKIGLRRPAAAAFLFAIVASITVLKICAAESPPHLPIEAFFRQPQVSQPRLSPDGTKIAFLFPHEKRMAIGILDRASDQSHMVLRGTDESIVQIFWKGNDRLVFTGDVAGNESFFIGSADLTGKNVLRVAESQRIENNLTGDAAGLLHSLPLDPDRIGAIGFFAGNVDNATFVGGALLLARINIRNRGLQPIFELRDSDRFAPGGFHFDQRGTLRLRGMVVGSTLRWECRESDTGRFHTVAEHPFHGYAETWDPQFFAADPAALWLISREHHDRGALHAVNTGTFALGEPIFVPPTGEITDLIATSDYSRLLGVRCEADRPYYHWFDPAWAAVHKKLEATFIGCDVRVTSLSRDENVALIWVGHDREPGVYYVLDRKTGSLRLFKRTHAIDPAALQPRKAITYTARDGLEIHGYLTLPRNAAGKRVPLVMLPHGGPFGVRESWGFDPEAQFLASRGYAVLQPNFRGSGGYGRSFIDRGRQQWGRAMQDDLSDGVRWAIAEGIADPARIAIYGASYGGYAALIGAMLTPELYACAVNYVGATDLELTFKARGEDAWRRGDEFSYQRAWVGETRAYRDETSPLRFVQRLRVPTFHAYGANDPRVKFDHWLRLEPLLQSHGKAYRKRIEGLQGHGFRDPEAAGPFYAELEQFLAEHLGPGAQPPRTTDP